MRTLLLTLSVTLVVLACGCPGGGPCSSADALFESPRATATASDAGVSIDVTWTPLPSAPAAFYASPSLVSAYRNTTSLRLTDAGTTSAHVEGDPLPSAGSASFELQYREGVLRTCSHVGMDDTYVLSVTVSVSPDGGLDAGTVKSSVSLGAL